VAKPAVRVHEFVERDFAAVPERRVTDVVRERERFDQGSVQRQCVAQGPRDLTDFEAVAEARAVVIPLAIQEDLRLVHQASKSRAVDDPVAVALEARAELVVRFRESSSARVFRVLRVRSQVAVFTRFLRTAIDEAERGFGSFHEVPVIMVATRPERNHRRRPNRDRRARLDFILTMRLLPSVVVPLSILAASCSAGDGSGSPEFSAEIPLGEAAYAGELVLRADTALIAPGAVATLTIVLPGTDDPLLSRSYDLGDPIWRAYRDEARLYFAIDGRDAWPGVDKGLQREMELVARFDPDGNPATDEPGTVRTRWPVRTGSPTIQVEITLALPVAAHARPGAPEPESNR